MFEAEKLKKYLKDLMKIYKETYTTAAEKEDLKRKLMKMGTSNLEEMKNLILKLPPEYLKTRIESQVFSELNIDIKEQGINMILFGLPSQIVTGLPEERFQRFLRKLLSEGALFVKNDIPINVFCMDSALVIRDDVSAVLKDKIRLEARGDILLNSIGTPISDFKEGRAGTAIGSFYDDIKEGLKNGFNFHYFHTSGTGVFALHKIVLDKIASVRGRIPNLVFQSFGEIGTKSNLLDLLVPLIRIRSNREKANNLELMLLPNKIQLATGYYDDSFIAFMKNVKLLTLFFGEVSPRYDNLTDYARIEPRNLNTSIVVVSRFSLSKRPRPSEISMVVSDIVKNVLYSIIESNYFGIPVNAVEHVHVFAKTNYFSDEMNLSGMVKDEVMSVLSGRKHLKAWMHEKVLVSLYDWYSGQRGDDLNFVIVKVGVSFDALIKSIALQAMSRYDLSKEDLISSIKEKSDLSNEELSLLIKIIGGDKK